MVERLLDVWLSVQAAEKLGEIAIARLRRRSLEGAAKRGGDARLRRRNVHSDDPTVQGVEFRCRNVLSFQLHHHCKRPRARGSFVLMAMSTVKYNG